ncbi:MAG TPA: OmpA family protein [Acidimicrobiia bacterium]
MSGHDDDDELHEEHEEHANHEAWVIPYADLLTLVMAMFIALFAISSVNVDKAKRLALGFNNAGSHPVIGLFSDSGGKSAVQGVGQNQTGGKGVLGGGSSPNDGASQSKGSPASTAITPSSAIQTAEKKEQQSFGNLEHKIEQAAQQQGVAGDITFEQEGRGLVVRLVSDNVLFASGKADVEPEGARVLEVVGSLLQGASNPIVVEGYTDNRPINTPQFQSNFYLSSARADNVLQFLVNYAGISDDRLSSIGYGDRDPIASNVTPDGRARNRRVEIVITSEVIEQILGANHLTNQAVDGSAAPSPSHGGTTPTTQPDLGNVVGKLGPGS